MKILVTVKRVEDPEITIKIKPDGSGIVTDNMKFVVNPFDEIAVEEALRTRDAHGGEVIVAAVGSEDAAHQIRTALAMGGDRGVHVVTDKILDPMGAAKALLSVIDEEKPDLVIMGKQAVDDDMGQIGGILAEKLGWGQATFASKEESLESDAEKSKTAAMKVADGHVEIVREVDGGIETLSLQLPAVVTTELRLNVPRYASLPGIMKAKKKEIKVKAFDEVVPSYAHNVIVRKMEAPPARNAGMIVEDVAALVDKLKNEAKVL